MPLVFGGAASEVQTLQDDDVHVTRGSSFEPHASCPNGAASNGLLSFLEGFWGERSEVRALTYSMLA